MTMRMRYNALCLLTCSVLIAVLPGLCFPIRVSAEEIKNPAAIRVLSDREVSQYHFTAKLDIQFNDMSFYNDSCKLSYHIYEGKPGHGIPNEEQLLAQENTRFDFELDDNGHCVFDMDINLFNFSMQECFVYIDIVDEQNSYWMAGYDPAILVTDSIAYIPSEETKSPAEISIHSDREVSQYHFTAKLDIQFNDMSFYNDSCKLSYHIYEGKPGHGIPNEEQLLAQENTRFDFELDDNGHCVFDMDINLFNFSTQECFVYFDIVDEQNSYWMAGYDPAILITDCIAYTPSEEDLLPPAVCRILGRKETSLSHTTVLVEVVFNDKTLYNDNCRLSYHVYNGVDESNFSELLTEDKLIQYENTRYAMSPDENGMCVVPIELNISAKNGKNQVLQFDIIDPDNNRWLLMTEPLALDTDVLVYQKNLIGAIKESVYNAAGNQPGQLILNILVFAATIIVIIVVIQKRLLSFKRKN